MANELDTITKGITKTNTQLEQFNSPTSYLDLLGKTAAASYHSNADLIAYREASRAQLYNKDPMYKPENYDMLSQGQREQIKNAPRGSLVAGIQAANETQQSRGTNIANLLQTEGGRYEDQRKALTDQLTGLTNRRATLETEQNKLKSENRNFGLDALTKYPPLRNLLTEKELSDMNKGNLTDSILAKIGQASAEWLRYKERQTNSVATTPQDKLLLKIKQAGFDVRRQTPIAGSPDVPIFSSQDPAVLAKYQNDPNYIIKGQDGQTPGDIYRKGTEAFAGQGVDFFGPNGQKVTPIQFQNEMVKRGVIVNPREIAQMFGSENPDDWAGTTTGARLAKEPSELDAMVSEAQGYIDSVYGTARQGAKKTQMISDIRADSSLSDEEKNYIISKLK